eukprot:m51a1_g14644 hypothetical protein (588) ;mRNA; r:66051-68884
MLALFAVLFVWRVVCGLALVRTYYDPDEYWQALEPAHALAYGYGRATWEWLPPARIRGWAHPLLFALLYRLLALLRLDAPWAVAYAPRLAQAALAAACDAHVARGAAALCGPRRRRAAALALACACASWYAAYCGARTLSNAAEAQLAVVALARLGLAGGVPRKGAVAVAMAIAGFTVVIRPTSAALWAVAVPMAAYRIAGRSLSGALRVMVVDMAPPAAAVVLAGVAVDRLCYGEWTLVPLNFLYQNIFMSVAEFYGTHPWHWYLTQGVPAILGSLLPLALAGVWIAARSGVSLAWAALAAWVVLVHSALSHKEFRFVFVAVPLLMPYCGLALDAALGAPAKGRPRTLARKALAVGACALVVLQAPMLLYFGLVHQRAPLALMDHLRAEGSRGAVSHVDFLTNCHATPFYSHAHAPRGTAPFNMTFLDCSPSMQKGYVPESDLFKADPGPFAQRRYCCRGECKAAFPKTPSHVAVFSNNVGAVRAVLESCGLAECAVFPHDHQRSLLLAVRAIPFPRDFVLALPGEGDFRAYGTRRDIAGKKVLVLDADAKLDSGFFEALERLGGTSTSAAKRHHLVAIPLRCAPR